jgi:L-2,4-diaminobutyrate transaminase
MSDATDRLQALDRKTILHSATQLRAHADGSGPPPRIMEGGDGVRVTDTEGKTFFDAFAGLYCVNIGYGRTEVADAIYEQAKNLAYYHTYVGHSNQALITLSERVLRMAPEGMSKIYYGLGGSDANELNVKLVWYYHNVIGRPEKKKIISRLRGYHGCTVMSAGLTGLPLYHTAFDLPVGPILHTECPHHYWGAEPGMSELAFSRYCADRLEAMIIEEGPETVGAFIGEPVLGTGGIIPPPEGYWDAIQTVLKKYEVLLIADEVICGFGRLGTPFGCHLYDIQPDLITIAKGLTSAYVPLSGVMVGDRVWAALEQGADEYGPFGHGYTYSGHPIGAAAANANLDIIERESLIDNARDTGAYFQQRLREAFSDHPLVGEVRGVGMLAALEFVANRERKQRFDPTSKVGPRVAAARAAEGLIARAMPHGDILGFAPPLVMSRVEADELIEKTRLGLGRVSDELVREGLWRAA